MHLLNTTTLEIRSFDGTDIPSYAILSHTWGKNELTYQDMKNDGKLVVVYEKVEMPCQLASEAGYDWIWIDTVCIDKSSSAELSEAINSMFTWYMEASVCFVWLHDLPSDGDLSTAFKTCKWFTRGWTLQELIASRHVLFYNQSWELIGDKISLARSLTMATGIDESVLHNPSLLSSISVAKRMSWAAHRVTTRPEDLAYCLLGIFDVNMPMLYGEGQTKAFIRLQEEIIKRTSDLSIFAWRAKPVDDGREFRGIFANSPREFAMCRNIIKREGSGLNIDYSVGNRGIQITTNLICLPTVRGQGSRYSIDLECRDEGRVQRVGIYLRKCGPNRFIRALPGELANISSEAESSELVRDFQPFLILREPPEIPAGSRTSGNPVTGNRTSALKINFPRGLRKLTYFPGSLWDEEDYVFASTDTLYSGWCATSIWGTLARNGKTFNVHVLFACFGWNTSSGTVQMTIFDLMHYNRTKLYQLLESLSKANSSETKRVMRELDYYFKPLLQSSVSIQQGDDVLSIRPNIAKKHLPGICSGQTHVVDFEIGCSTTTE
jgi:hypothetical protein